MKLTELNEHLKKFIEWHNENYPNKYIPNTEIGRFNIKRPNCDHNYKEAEDEWCNAVIRCTKCKKLLK